MSEISTTIRVNDGFSTALRRMNSALDTVMNSLIDTQKQLGKPFNLTGISEARKEIARANTALDLMADEARNAASAQNQLNNASKNSGGAVAGLASKVKGLVAAYAGWQGMKNALGAADAYANTTSRLELMNDGLTTTAQLEQMIRDSADRTRSSFQTTADAVGKMGIQAASAFNNSQDVVNFVEQLNKHLIVSGTSTAAAEGAMLQLTQAMGAGVLRGEELNSILEGMPTVANAIKKYFAETLGDTRPIKEIAEEGLITSKIVKDALYSAADGINAKFDNMKVTFGSLWVMFKNQANKALVPVFNRLTELSNSVDLKSVVVVAGQVVGTLGKAVIYVMDAISGLFTFIKNNFSLVAPILFGVAGGFAAVGVAAMLAKAKIALTTVAMVIHKTVAGLAMLATYGFAGAITYLSAVLSVNPIMLVVYGVIALIAAFYMAVAAVNKFCGTSLSATGMIAGAVMWLGSVIYNTFAMCWNAIIEIANYMWNVFADLGNMIYNAFNGGFTGWIGGVKSALWTFVDWAYQLIKPLIEVWDKVKGTNYASSLQGKIDKGVNSGKSYEYKELFKKNLADPLKLEYMDSNALYQKGYKWGENLADNFSLENISDKIKKELGLDSINEIASQAMTSDALKNNATNPALRGSGNDYGTALDKIADNTDKMAKDDKELELLRDLGTREAVNRFTTAQVSVMQKNSNNIREGADVDSIIAKLYAGLRDAMSRTAEGAHF